MLLYIIAYKTFINLMKSVHYNRDDDATKTVFTEKFSFWTT